MRTMLSFILDKRKINFNTSSLVELMWGRTPHRVKVAATVIPRKTTGQTPVWGGYHRMWGSPKSSKYYVSCQLRGGGINENCEK